MTQITAKLVAELRGRTGAGMMDCKKALEETAGDIEKAVDLLRAKGIAKAEKRAGRQASEGQIVTIISPDGSTGALVEVNCETDFVGRNDEFKALTQGLAEHVVQDASVVGVVTVGNEGEYLAGTHPTGGTVGEVIKAASAKTGEHVVMRRIARFASTGGTVGAYLHHNGKVGVLVEIAGGTGDAVMTLAKSVAEHIAAGVPAPAVSVDKDGVPAELVEREKAIFVEQAAASGKPANIIEKMVSGRIDKFFAEITLVNQPWVRDDSKTIGQLVKEAGAGLSVTRFARFQMGEE
jgi:elongation factor Ts